MFAELASPTVMAVLLLAGPRNNFRAFRATSAEKSGGGPGRVSFSRAPLKGINTAAPRAFYSPEFYYSAPSFRQLASPRIHRDYE